jgi:hypothetical protein
MLSWIARPWRIAARSFGRLLFVFTVRGEGPFWAPGLTCGQWLAALSLAAVPFVVPALFKVSRRPLAASGPRSRIHSSRAMRS